MSRFELLLDGQHAGLLDYQVRGNDIVFLHTEIDPARREKGLGGELVRGALNLVRGETEYRLVAKCPFTAAFVEKHPEYADLLTR